MEADKITMADMVAQMITDNRLSAKEEAEIMKMIEEKQRKRGGRCLAEVIEVEMSKKLGAENIKMKNMYQSVFQKCFKDSKAGNTVSFKLSEKVISKFKKDVRELYGLNENEMVFFMGMLQVGLDKMAEEGGLNFTPDKEMFRNFLQLKHRISYIDNPYTYEETEKIMEWTEMHPADVKGLAVSLWFTGGISFTEIVSLAKTDCWGNKRAADSIMQFKENLFEVSTRAKIVRNALNMHPKDVRYVFVVPRRDNSGWRRLSEQELQGKLWHICKQLEITYKTVSRDEALRIGQ